MNILVLIGFYEHLFRCKLRLSEFKEINIFFSWITLSGIPDWMKNNARPLLISRSTLNHIILLLIFSNSQYNFSIDGKTMLNHLQYCFSPRNYLHLSFVTKKIKKRSKVIRNEKYRSEAEQINHHTTQ